MSPVSSGVLIDESNNKGLIDIGKYSSIKESKQIQVKTELEMPGSSKGRHESIPDIENGNKRPKSNWSKLQRQNSMRFELGRNLEDEPDEVWFNSKYLGQIISFLYLPLPNIFSIQYFIKE